MKALCIKYDKQFGFVKGCIYDVYETPLFGGKYSNVIKYTIYVFKEYFYTEQELRKIKLKRINESR